MTELQGEMTTNLCTESVDFLQLDLPFPLYELFRLHKKSFLEIATHQFSRLYVHWGFKRHVSYSRFCFSLFVVSMSKGRLFPRHWWFVLFKRYWLKWRVLEKERKGLRRENVGEILCGQILDGGIWFDQSFGKMSQNKVRQKGVLLKLGIDLIQITPDKVKLVFDLFLNEFDLFSFWICRKWKNIHLYLTRFMI